MIDRYLQRLTELLSFGHPVKIRDVATLTLSSEEEVLQALAELRSLGVNVVSDGVYAEVRSSES